MPAHKERIKLLIADRVILLRLVEYASNLKYQRQKAHLCFTFIDRKSIKKAFRAHWQKQAMTTFILVFMRIQIKLVL
jgi:hypothetical protein